MRSARLNLQLACSLRVVHVNIFHFRIRDTPFPSSLSEGGRIPIRDMIDLVVTRAHDVRSMALNCYIISDAVQAVEKSVAKKKSFSARLRDNNRQRNRSWGIPTRIGHSVQCSLVTFTTSATAVASYLSTTLSVAFNVFSPGKDNCKIIKVIACTSG